MPVAGKTSSTKLMLQPEATRAETRRDKVGVRCQVSGFPLRLVPGISILPPLLCAFAPLREVLLQFLARNYWGMEITAPEGPHLELAERSGFLRAPGSLWREHPGPADGKRTSAAPVPGWAGCVAGLQRAPDPLDGSERRRPVFQLLRLL